MENVPAYNIPYFCYAVPHTICTGSSGPDVGTPDTFTLQLASQMKVKVLRAIEHQMFLMNHITKHQLELKNLMPTYCENVVFNGPINFQFYP